MRHLQRYLPIFTPYLLIAVWTAAVLYISIKNPTVGISDMFGFIPRAESLSFKSLSPWVNGFYPLGYPVVLRSLSVVTGDYVIAGRVVSLICGVVALVVAARLSGLIFGTPGAIAAVLVCITNPLFIRYSTISSTDMPAATFLIVGVYMVCRYELTGRLRLLLTAGAAIGVAYLVRYTALTVVPAALVFLWLQPEGSWKSRVVCTGVFTLGFLIMAAPQLLLSAIAHGSPFWNLQAQNVYFGMFGDGNWGHNMADARSINSLSEVILQQPVLFLRHWYYNLLRAPNLKLVQFPLHLLAWGGLLFGLRHKRSRTCALLLILVLVAFTAAICMAFPNERLLLFPALILSLTAGYAVVAFIPVRLSTAFSISLPLRAPLLVVLGFWLGWNYVRPAILHPLPEYDRTRIEVSKVLGAQGVERSSSVLSLSFDYYDMTKRTKDRYALSWYATGFEPYQSVQDVAERMRKAGQRYLVFDKRAPHNVRGLNSIWPFDPTQMAEYFDHISTLSGSVHVYRVRDLPNNRMESDK
jgi:4-amino-4-deoxy-L-arabinose transferase-like glycosyltransferase